MQHKTLEDLQRVAAIYPDQTRPAMTRSQRLERWAELLEREPGRRLGALHGTEYQPSDTRDTMRSILDWLDVFLAVSKMLAASERSDCSKSYAARSSLADRARAHLIARPRICR